MRRSTEWNEKRRGFRGRRWALLGGFVVAAWAAVAAWRAGGPPAVRIEPALPGIGKRTPVVVAVEEPRRGLADVRVELVQGERVETLAERSYPAPSTWVFWSRGRVEDRLVLAVGRETVPGLSAGEATIRVVARPAGTWLRRPQPTVRELTLPVRLSPPLLEVLSTQHYVAQGGVELVVYRAGPSAARDGVAAGNRWFPGYPAPDGGERTRFALFAAPYDLDDPAKIRLVAADEVGNEASVAFVDRFFPRPMTAATLEVDGAFLERVVPPILAGSPEVEDRGDLLESYLAINGELRRANARTLEELAASSRREFLWHEPFLALPDGQVMSSFADRRTYVYGGREIDRQDHLGFDLASLARSPVPAANSGVVALARYLGIYGNTVVIDHGFGLMTLYGHLSSLEVAEGDAVERGQIVGRTGQTGLAGGDHLHFTVLLAGLPVNPIEWWDGHWIRDRLARKLPALAGVVAGAGEARAGPPNREE